MTCIMCRCELELNEKRYIASLENCVIIIKNVPAMVCASCGETHYGDEVEDRIRNIIDELEKFVDEVAVVDYSKTTY